MDSERDPVLEPLLIGGAPEPAGPWKALIALGIGILAFSGLYPPQAPAGAEQEKVDVANLVKARLVADVDAVAPQIPFKLAVYFDVAPQWHIYWENPGDSGLATRVNLTAPEGFEVSPLLFPGPDRFDLPGGLVNYGYADKAALFLDVVPPAQAGSGPVELSAEVKWLVCHDRCIPQRQTVTLTLPTATGKPNAVNQALLAPFLERLPEPWASLPGGRASWVGEPGLKLRVEARGCQALDFFPGKDLPPTFEGSAAEAGGAAVTATFTAPTAPEGLVRADCPGRGPRFYHVTADVAPLKRP